MLEHQHVKYLLTMTNHLGFTFALLAQAGCIQSQFFLEISLDCKTLHVLLMELTSLCLKDQI